MKHCPDPNCGHRVRTGQAAEYLDRINECAECGTPLVEGSTATPRGEPSTLGTYSRLLVTLGAAAAVVMARRWQLDLGGTQLAPFRLGLAPVISAFIAVEAIAIVVPRFRPLRRLGRDRLHRTALGLSLLFALTMGAVAASTLPLGDHLVAISLWVVAVSALAAVAGLVSRFGLGNGYAVLLAAGVIPRLHELGIAAGRARDGGPVLLAGVVLASVVGATLMVLGAHRRSGPRLPTCGILPLDAAALLFALPAPLHTVAFAHQGLGVSASLLVSGAFTAAVALALGHVFARGSADADALALAAVRSVLFTGAVFTAGGLLATVRLPVPTVYSVVLATAVTLDLWQEWRARVAQPGEWETAVVVLSVTEIDPALRQLADAGIPTLTRGTGFRSLVHFFGPFAPLAIRVPRGDQRRALEALG